MVDGLPDGWAGSGIPVCVLSPGSGQHDNGGGTMSGRGNGSLIMERDYIGLGLPPLTSPEGLAKEATSQVDEAKMDCSRVELRLGLGPPNDKAREASHPTQEGHHDSNSFNEDLLDHGAEPKQHVVACGAPLQPSSHSFWQQSFRLNLSSDHQQLVPNPVEAAYLKSMGMPAAWGQVGAMAALGRFNVPVPKVSTVPAKRPYLEAVGEKGASSGNFANSIMSELPVQGDTFVGGMMYPWNGEALQQMPMPNVVVGGGAWQQAQMNYDQGPNYGKSIGSSPFGRPIISAPLSSPPQFKVPPNPTPSKSPIRVDPSSSAQAMEVPIKSEPESEQNRCKAPVVGWPPVRAFRKNTLHAASNNQLSSDDPLAKSMGGGDVSEQIIGSNGKNAFFVKAKLDGVRICRKVDLTAYGSYEALKSALQEMFQGFVSGNAKLDLLHGHNYAVTYEDKDGDCLLVGDVPWNMFVTSTVKSVRIMKAMDAVGIGDKGTPKLKAQESVKP